MSNFPHLPEDEDAINAYFVSSTEAGKPKEVTPEMLSKIWRIDLEAAKRTIEVTSQSGVRSGLNNLSRNFSTNDRMLRYKRIKEYFYMDTFFASKKGGRSSRGHTCV